jgi:hypothetical protein
MRRQRMMNRMSGRPMPFQQHDDQMTK